MFFTNSRTDSDLLCIAYKAQIEAFIIAVMISKRCDMWKEDAKINDTKTFRAKINVTNINCALTLFIQ